MSFCPHCEGQRFDRARVLRILRASRKQLQGSEETEVAQDALTSVIDTIRRLEIPHLELDEVVEGEIIH